MIPHPRGSSRNVAELSDIRGWWLTNWSDLRARLELCIVGADREPKKSSQSRRILDLGILDLGILSLLFYSQVLNFFTVRKVHHRGHRQHRQSIEPLHQK